MSNAYTDRSKHLRGKDVADREERKSMRERGIILQPRYREHLGPTPVLAPGDTEGAVAYLNKIKYTLQIGGWTRDERNRIKRIRRKWERKANGQDTWFNENGNPIGGEEGNAYGREGYTQQRKRAEIRAAVKEIEQRYSGK